MAPKLPAQLSALLAAASPKEKEQAWTQLVEEFSKILLHAARNGSPSYDETMDRYAFILERLQADDFRRLRSYSSTGPGQFTTWLFVVARRLSVDHHRKAVGRVPRPTQGQNQIGAPHHARERLARFVAEELDPADLPDPSGESPETAAWLAERNNALSQALQDLDPGDRLLLTLRFVDEVPVRSIATIMSFSSPFQAYRRIKKLLEKLRLELGKRGVSGV